MTRAQPACRVARALHDRTSGSVNERCAAARLAVSELVCALDLEPVDPCRARAYRKALLGEFLAHPLELVAGPPLVVARGEAERLRGPLEVDAVAHGGGGHLHLAWAEGDAVDVTTARRLRGGGGAQERLVQDRVALQRVVGQG